MDETFTELKVYFVFEFPDQYLLKLEFKPIDENSAEFTSNQQGTGQALSRGKFLWGVGFGGCPIFVIYPLRSTKRKFRLVRHVKKDMKVLWADGC